MIDKPESPQLKTTSSFQKSQNSRGVKIAVGLLAVLALILAGGIFWVERNIRLKREVRVPEVFVASSEIFVQGQVYCQDDGGSKYPMPGVVVEVFHGSERGDIPIGKRTTDSDGFYSRTINHSSSTGVISYLDPRPELLPDLTLPDGARYRDMLPYNDFIPGDLNHTGLRTGCSPPVCNRIDTRPVYPSICQHPGDPNYQIYACLASGGDSVTRLDYRFKNCSPPATPSPSPSPLPSPETSPPPTGPGTAQLKVKVGFLGRSDNDWKEKVEVCLKETDKCQEVQLDDNGFSPQLSFDSITSGQTYTIQVKRKTYLSGAKQQVLNSGDNGMVDMGKMPSGDLNADEVINSLDWSWMKMNFLKI